MADVITLTEESFEKAVSQSVAVVDFYADWCGPCQAMKPVFAKVAGDYEGKVNFYKVNVDENRKLSIQNRVMSIPAFLLFKDGKQIARRDGGMSEADLKAFVNQAL